MAEEFKSFYKTVESGEGDRCHYPTRLDTYGCGCAHNCAYCYARALLDFRGLWNPADPRPASISEIREVIKKRCKPGDVIRLGGMTDCFQPKEREARVTYETIKALNERGVGYLIVTKNNLVAEQDYLDIMDKRLAHIQVSITSTSPETSKRMEPGAPLPAERIAAVERLQAEGFDVQVRLSPFIPELLDLDIINGIRCDKFLVEFLRVNATIEKWLRNCGIEVAKRYSYQSGGYSHQSLLTKVGYVERLKKDGRQISVCEDAPGHFEYWQKLVNENPDDCCNLRK